MMEKFFSQSFTQKIFMALVMGLFLGGCSTTEPATPSDALVDLIGGKWGQFYADDSEGVSTLYGFGIIDDATYYYENGGFKADYTTGSDNSATYEGVNSYEVSLKIRLTSLTSTGGTYIMYNTGVKVLEVDFTWYTESTSSISAESHSSIMHAISLQK